MHTRNLGKRRVYDLKIESSPFHEMPYIQKRKKYGTPLKTYGSFSFLCYIYNLWILEEAMIEELWRPPKGRFRPLTNGIRRILQSVIQVLDESAHCWLFVSVKNVYVIFKVSIGLLPPYFSFSLIVPKTFSL